jgi:hypothetical protein
MANETLTGFLFPALQHLLNKAQMLRSGAAALIAMIKNSLFPGVRVFRFLPKCQKQKNTGREKNSLFLIINNE